jgi:hypothetical protein
MTTAALITIIITHTIVISTCTYFFIKVLRTPLKPEDEETPEEK